MSKSSRNAHRVPPYRRPIIVVSFLIILAAATVATIVILNLNHPTETSPEPERPSISLPVRSDEDDEAADLLPEPEDKVTQYEGENPNTLPELTGNVVAYLSSDRRSYTAAASIDQYLITPGACTLYLKNSSGATVYTSDPLPTSSEATTSACGPFEIPLNGLNPGNYQIEITVTSDTKTGLITAEVQL